MRCCSVIGTGRAFSGPASSALVPHLVPTEHFVNAVTWGATVFQIANIAGPAVGGLLFTLPLARWGLPHIAGAPVVFLFTLLTLVGFLTLIGMLAVRPGGWSIASTTFDLLLEGLRYVWRAKLLLGSVSLDLFVVLLGGAVALMPIFAENILHTGARGLGVLRAAPALGALAVSILLSFRPIRRRAGRMMFICVAIFGVATIVFGLSRSLWLSLDGTGDPGRGGHGERRHPLFPAAAGDAAFDARARQRRQLSLRGRIERTRRIRERTDGAMDGAGAGSRPGRHRLVDGDGAMDGALSRHCATRMR